MSKGTESWDAAERRGAARMRRRIRAKQREALAMLRTKVSFPLEIYPMSFEMLCRAVGELDAATLSAPRKGRGR